MERKYLAIYDDGHDYGEFIFYSAFRAGSASNLEDARTTFARKYGYHRARRIYIVSIERCHLD